MALLIVAPLQETLLPKVMAVQECKNSKLDIRQNPDKETGKKFNEMASKKTERPSSEKTGFHKDEAAKASKDSPSVTKEDVAPRDVETQQDSLSQTTEVQSKQLEEGFADEIFSECFELEFEYLKNMVLVKSDICKSPIS